MHLVLMHNEKWSKLPVLAHSEQQSRIREKSAADVLPLVFVFLNFHHDGVLKIQLDSTILNVAFEAPLG